MNLFDLTEAKATKQRLDPKCWSGHHKEGTKVKGGVRVNNCVPNESIEEGIEIVYEKVVAEGGAETSWSNDTDTITLQDILELTKHIKQINLPINDNLKSKLLHWEGNPEEIERVNQVTVSNQFPILIMVNEQGQIEWILDGNHRLHKAIQSQAKTIPAKLIRPNNLNDKAKKIFNIKEQGVAEEKVRLDPKCWTGKHIGNPATKVKGGVRVNNCVPNESMDEDYNKGMKMADYVAQADRLHDEMMRCQHENDQTGYERAKQAYLELERQARQGMVPETAGTTAATMPPSPAAAAQAKAIVQKAADDRAISLANVARVVPNNVAEASGAWPFADINEVSDATLTSYKQKAHKSAEQLSAAGKHRAATDRYGNIMKATGKQIDRTTKNIAKALGKK